MKEIKDPVTVTLGNGDSKTFTKYEEEIFTEKTTLEDYLEKKYYEYVKTSIKIKEDDRYSLYGISKDENSEELQQVLYVL